MPFEVGVISFFEAAHSLKGEREFGPASRLHGHSYKVEALVQGKSLSESGILCDISTLRGSLESVLRNILHFRRLDELDELREINTTAEELARFIHSKIAHSIASERTVDSLTIRVWENEINFASFTGGIR